MKHQVKTEEEIAESGLLQPGVYDFTVLTATETTSKSGNDMFTLKLNVFDHDGSIRPILDWVLPDFPKKYKHLHDALGLLELYQSGETKGSDLEGKSGKLQLGIGKPYQDNNGIDRVNNSVVDYIKRDSTETYKAASTKTAADTLEGDDIPF